MVLVVISWFSGYFLVKTLYFFPIFILGGFLIFSTINTSEKVNIFLIGLRQ